MATAKKSIAAGTSSKYEKFLSNLDLYAIGMDELRADLKRTEYAAAISDKTSSIEHGVVMNFALAELDDDHFDVTGSFVLTMGLTDKSDAFVSISAKFSAHFHPKAGKFRRSDAEKFADSEARLLFWPYFRQTIADTTARMYIRPITVPFMFRP
jgi:preprotein translocase subunit SecB